MGANRRYAEQVGQLIDANIQKVVSRPPVVASNVRPWKTPWPPIEISDCEWMIMRDSHERPAAVIRRIQVGPRHETLFRVVTWAPTSEGRSLVGYYSSLAEADQAVLFKPDRPNHPDIRTASGH